MKTRDKHLTVRLKMFLIIFCLASLTFTACGDDASDMPALTSVIEQIPEEELNAPGNAAASLPGPVSGDADSELRTDSKKPENDTGETEALILPDSDEDPVPAPEEQTDEALSPAPFIETVPRHDYSAGHGYYYRFLGSAAAAAYDDIYYSCENSTGEVNFTVQILESDFYSAWDAFRYDHPEFFWIRSSRQGYSDSLGHVVKAEFNIPEDAAGLAAGLTRTADSIVSGILSLSERERVRYIYEWIINNTSYSLSDNDYDQCAAGVLFNHRAVCAGYADAFKLLCDRAGVRCITVVGDALNDDGSLRGRHAWNQVQIGASHYWVDTTWGDPQFSDDSDSHWDPSFINYSFLCISDDPFLISHRIDNMLGRNDVPGHFIASYAGCSDPFLDEYTLRGCLCNTAEEVMSCIMTGIAGGQKTISVKLTGDAGYQQTVAALFDGGGIQQILNSLGPVFTECQYFTSPASRTLTVEFR